MYNCKILADSISDHGHRLTTFEITFPRIVLAEYNTHRMLSRNAASSRAIPVHKRIKQIAETPFYPVAFGKNQKGMVAEANLTDKETSLAKQVWGDAVTAAIRNAAELEGLGVHKQLANRVIEPYSWCTIITTGTDWDNFFKLRCAPDAQPEINKIATMMLEAYIANVPVIMGSQSWRWHLPLVNELEIEAWVEENDALLANDYWKKVSVGRCARVSYLTHDGKRDPEADVALYDRLWKSGHASPFEHVARPFSNDEWNVIDTITNTPFHNWAKPFASMLYNKVEYAGNLHGWVSHRIEREYALQ